MTYERMTVQPHAGPQRTYLLEMVAEGDLWVQGFEVNKEGMRISGKGFDERKHVILRSCIVRRTPLVMNLHYGELEEA